MFNVLYIVMRLNIIILLSFKHVHILNTESRWVFMVGLNLLNLHNQQPSTICPFLPVKLQLLFDIVLVGFFIHAALISQG